MLIPMIIDSIAQLAALTAVPFIWWLITARREQPFLAWIGLTKPRLEGGVGKLVAYSVVILLSLLAPGIYLMTTFEDKSVLASAQFAGTGIEGLLSLLVFAIIQTGLSEEIFFRGLLTKRLGKIGGTTAGNIVQAAVFGLIHGVIFFAFVPPVTAALITAFTVLAGYLMAHINEKMAGGSIIPSWIIHSIVNIISAGVFWAGLVTV